MLRPRALVTIAAFVGWAVSLPACDGSATAPRSPLAGPEPASSRAGLSVTAAPAPAPVLIDVRPSPDGYLVRVSAPKLDPRLLDTTPIKLSLYYAGPSPAEDVMVVFSPRDQSEPLVARVRLNVGVATSLGLSRGHSKYSVIFF